MVEKKFSNGQVGKVDEESKIVYLDYIGGSILDTVKDAVSIMNENSGYAAVRIISNNGLKREYYITPGMTVDGFAEKYMKAESAQEKRLWKEADEKSKNAPENARIAELQKMEKDLEEAIKSLREKQKKLYAERAALEGQVEKRENDHVYEGMKNYYEQQHAANNEKILEEIKKSSQAKQPGSEE